MDRMSQYCFVAGFVGVGIATVAYLLYVIAIRRPVAGKVGGDGRTVAAVGWGLGELGSYGTTLAALGFGFLTLSLIFRTLVAGRGPFANTYEFSVAFGWGIVGAYLYFERRYGVRVLGAAVLPVATALLRYASTVPSNVEPLVPALQNNLLLTLHVAAAIVAYGTFAVAFGAAVLYLLRWEYGAAWLPGAGVLDEVGYRAVVVGFPFLALVIILGAVWADVAWGRYWGWDPKETASLVTWLIYGGYLHARVMRGWRERRSAVLLIVGFVATLFTYFGNRFFGGLHAY